MRSRHCSLSTLDGPGNPNLMRDGVCVPEDGAEYTVGQWLTFDPRTETHTGDFAKEANELLKDPNR